MLHSPGEDPRRRMQGLASIVAETKWSAFDQRLDLLRAEVAELDLGLRQARDLLSQGETAKGKASVEALLAKWPGCDEAKALLEGLIADERERAAGLKAAREAVRDGRLVEAQRCLLRLVVGGFAADEARSLLRDVERVRARVSREAAGLGASLEAGADPTLILAQLAKLQKSQQDSVELGELEARALRSRGRDELERRVHTALARQEAEACIDAVRQWVSQGGEGGLDHRDQSKLRALGAEIESTLKVEIGRGHASFAAELAGGLRTWQQALGVELDSIAGEAQERVAAARSRARMGLEAIEAKRLDDAERLLEEAREFEPGEPEVLRLAHRLRAVANDRATLERALDLAQTDRQGAIEQLSALGPTPRPLGSLVLQLKEKVERSGELEHGCLLQVEEAGEFLVFTENRLRIGNATGRSFPQIPVLARIKPHHATLERTVSFHGGVQDTVSSAAPGAEVVVNGVVTSAQLKHGDRFVLGGILPFSYLRPSPRSLSALLRLERGFESRGTSRILWIKQGGKDGRVWIGRGKEVHVRVPHAEPELFLFAPGRGRLRVCFAGVGTIDGDEFTGERELDAGCSVRCGQIAFRVLPL